MREALAAIKQKGNTPIGPVRRTHDGRLAARVFPAGPVDGVLFKGVTAEVHFQRGVEPAQLDSERARFYKRPDHAGRVTLVLSAGNINAIPAMDVVTRMFNEGTACVLKVNPVNAYLGPYLVDQIQLTGSDKTYDRLLGGPPGPERDARKAQGRRVLDKPILAELGNGSPVIVAPGRFSEKELAYQAEDVAASLTYNASFNCNAA